MEGGSANIGTKKKENELPPDEHRCGRTKGKWRCKNFRMSYGAAAADDDTFPKIKVCEKHYNDDKNRKKKKTSGDGEGAGSGPVSEKLLPPDEERCCHTDGKGWRCKKFRMGHGADADADADDDHSVPKTKYCGKHHNHFAEMNLLRKKSSGNGDTSVIGAKRKHVERTKTVVETRASKRRMNVMEGDQFVAETSNQPATHDNCDYKLGSFCPADTIVEGGSDNNGRKMKHAERMSRELESLSGTREAAAELESLKHHKSKSMELQKKKAECTELVKKAKNKKTRKTTSTDENEQTLADATERWKKLLLCCLQSKVNEKSTRGCGESRISNSESLVFRSGKESSISRCVELRNAERVVSEVPGLENDITQSCENPTDDSNRGILNAETSSGGRKDSHVHECKTKEKVLNVSDAGANKHNESEYEFPKYAAMNIFSAALHLSSEGQNVEEGEGWGSSKRSSQHHLESLNEYEDFDIPVDPKNSLGDPMEMLAMKNWKRNNDEMKWKSEPDMLSSFEEDPEICLKAICALYRQEISEDPISPKGLLFDDDTVRCTTLAKFLMDEDCKGDLKKSMKELETLDSKAVDDCKMLARRYSLHLFYIYKDKKDPFFRPATTASQGEQTSK